MGRRPEDNQRLLSLPATLGTDGRPVHILIIDDDEAAAGILVSLLRRAGIREVEWCGESDQGMSQYLRQRPDLVFLDFHMPGADGFQVLDWLRSLPPPAVSVPIVMLTGDGDVQTRRRALARGATDFLLKPFDAVEVILRARTLLTTRGLQLELEAQNTMLEARVADRTAALEEAQLEMLRRLAAAAELHDDETGLHTQRVGRMAGRLARALGVPAVQAVLIERAAPLHDLGKIGVGIEIVRKPGGLTREELLVMQTHAALGAHILSGGRSALMRLAERIARHHHEWWDGSGYPDRLAGEVIPLEARIVAVADVFDALTHDRPYRGAIPVAETIEMMCAESGTHFDPRVLSVFVALVREPVLEAS